MSSREPLAIVGMACRFPGGASRLDRFWQLLENGVDAICDVPPGRWDSRKYYSPNPDKPGKAYVNQGGFLQESVDEFDPFFFRMSPREAESLDPQQRILLEVTWESIEDAGIPLANLEGPGTGVFVGGFCLDANHLQLSPLNRESIDSHTATSSSMAMLANRVSYIFNLQGPSVTVDTACSSSLVATHLACQSLWNGECDVAIAGGTNVILLPETTVTMSKGKFLSVDGRCMTFDSRANGYVRGEGAGTVVLKRLSQARQDGDHIYAQVVATGINQDGRTSGITFPSGESQKALMRRVYAGAGVQPADIDYIEAHGTGTQAGDVTEATALHEVLSEGRSHDDQVIVGSVKSNIGHLEAAAGVAGLIKTSLCLDRGRIVPNLHFQNPNPSIPFDTNCLTVPTNGQEWQRSNGRPRMAAINSFGYGGTNAHVLLQEAPDSGSTAPSTASVNGQSTSREEQLVCLSASGEAALREQTRKYVNWLKDVSATVPFADIVFSMNRRRSHLDNRLAILARSSDDLAARLRTWSREEFAEGVIEGAVDAGPLTFVYTGMGPQWWGMGRRLFESEPVFAESLRRCDALFQDIAGWSVLDEIRKDEADSRVQETQIAQPANLAIQVALTELWKSWGVVPDAIVGHSIGEVAAAWASGALSLEDALLVSYHRSRLQATTAGTGTMLAVGLSEQDARERILTVNNGQTHVSIAAINSPSSVTLAGDQEFLEACEKELQADGVFARFLTVEVPYHSHKMDPLREELLKTLQPLTPRETHTPLYSTVTAQPIDGRELDNEYWWRNVRETVRFADAAATLIANGHRHFLEVGPHPVLRPSLREALSYAGKKGHTLESLNRKEPDDRGTLLNTLGQLYTLGVDVDLERWCDSDAAYTKLPGYSWQKEKYWRESAASRQERFGQTGPTWFHQDLRQHGSTWEVELSPFYFPYLTDHVVQGNVVFPGAAYVEAGLELQRRLNDRPSCVIEHISFVSMLAVADDRAPRLQLHYDENSRYYAVHSSLNDDHDRWTLHARGKLIGQEITSLMETRSLDELKTRCPTQLDPQQQYETLKLRGLEYGPAFRTITDWRRGDGEVLVELQLSDDMNSLRDDSLLHPTLLDGAFQSLVALFDTDSAAGQSFVPVEIEKLLFYAPVGARCWAHAQLLHTTGTLIEGTIELIGESGEVLASLQGVQCKAIAGSSKVTEVKNCRYGWSWSESAAPPADETVDTSDESWLILADQDVDPVWSRLLQQAGVNCVTAWPETPEELQQLLSEHSTLNVLYPWPSIPDSSSGLPHERLTQRLWPLNVLAASAAPAGLETLRITCLTGPTQQVTQSETIQSPDAGALQGLLPLVSNEYHSISTYLIDHDEQTDPESILRDVLTKSSETSIAWRDGRRFVKQLQHVSADGQESEELEVVSTKDTNLELCISKPGSLDSLEFVRKERRAPGPGEIEIEVYASSLNFKDLLKVYGQIADNVIKDTYFGNSLGMELSGVVTRVGEGVTEFKAGDDVAGPIRGSFCSYATVPTTYVIHRPGPLTFNQTPVYIGYLAAFRGLVHCAQLAEGEKILIHNATGGVGIAALQIARWKNAEIYATAGTKEKREYLREQGVEHIYDSRSLLFVEQILRDTDGYGVDVVINAIAGEALYESFDILAPYGRFIEIGKKDIGDDNGLPMRAFNRNLTFTAVDMDRMLVDRVPIVQQILRDISDNFESGIFQPVPMAEFKASDAREAFAFMAQSRHMGKVVLEFKDDQVPLRPAESQQQLDANGSYLITGGTAGFGLQVAGWLAAQRPGRLYLVSRSGVKSEDDQRFVDGLQEYTDVVVRCLDVTDRSQVDELLSEIRTSDCPLKGIIHGAMVLDDGFLADMTPERWSRVLAPKVDGAWNLHHASQQDPLDWFLMFSSVASVIGNPGQASYVAANSFLDSFAHFRRSQGLPASTINWGVLLEAGVVARNADVGDVLEASGIHGFTNQQAFDGLQMVTADQPVQTGLFDIDWSRVKTSFPMLAASATFVGLIESEGSGSPGNRQREELLEQLLPLSPDERQHEIEQRLLQTISSILRIPANRIGADKLIADLGIDSLVAVELTVALQKELGVELTTVDLLGMPTVRELAALLLSGLISDEDELLARLDDLSEEELDQLLSENADLVSAQQQGTP